MRREDQLAVPRAPGTKCALLQGSGFDCVADGGEYLEGQGWAKPRRCNLFSGGNLLQGCGLGMRDVASLRDGSGMTKREGDRRG